MKKTLLILLTVLFIGCEKESTELSVYWKTTQLENHLDYVTDNELLNEYTYIGDYIVKRNGMSYYYTIQVDNKEPVLIGGEGGRYKYPAKFNIFHYVKPNQKSSIILTVKMLNKDNLTLIDEQKFHYIIDF